MSDEKGWETVAMTPVIPGFNVQVWKSHVAPNPVLFSPILPVVALVVERHPVHGERRRMLAVDGTGQIVPFGEEPTADRRVVTTWTDDWAPGGTVLDRKDRMREPEAQWTHDAVSRYIRTDGGKMTWRGVIYDYKQSLEGAPNSE